MKTSDIDSDNATASPISVFAPHARHPVIARSAKRDEAIWRTKASFIVIPAKAGISSRDGCCHANEIPAFAGMTSGAKPRPGRVGARSSRAVIARSATRDEAISSTSRHVIAAAAIVIAFLIAAPARAEDMPPDFPTITVPGHEREMAVLRDLYWLHYQGAGPKATMWDEWLSGPALWPAVETNNWTEIMRSQWRDALAARLIDDEGYVATHQHASIAHQRGWPFPFWSQGLGGYGWHFSFMDAPPEGWRPNTLNTQAGWESQSAEDAGLFEDGWRLVLTAADAFVVTPIPDRAPNFAIEARQAPFMQLRWKASGLGGKRPYIEWITEDDLAAGRDFSSAQRVHFDPIESDALVYTMIPVYKHAAWRGQIKRIRIGFPNTGDGHVTIHSFFSQYDTRHNINAQAFVRGCAKYFWWTADVEFLKSQAERMRTAIRFVMNEHRALEKNVVDVSGWWGHEGRSGIARDADGKKSLLYGEGIGNNYWDLLPFGGLDCYATVQYYDTLITMEKIERAIRSHPEWGIAPGVDLFEPDFLAAHAAKVKETGNELFWNPETGRFNACIDVDGVGHDFGFTFLNLEAVAYDFATPGHATAIMQWINGDRIVEGDTAQGADIYHWRFAPRATTRRNIEWYGWFWSNPESIPWGGQVQDGGAVLGFSYHDILARLKVLGPDNAWQRLQEILAWFAEVQTAGGYRKYYDGSREGSLQGCGTPGGLGLDCEFFESVMVPQVIVDGFLGLDPSRDVLRPSPNLPRDWPSVTIDRINWRGTIMDFTASRPGVPNVEATPVPPQKLKGDPDER
jgi:hypothetical protein